MAALAITDTPDGRRVLALTGRLDATTLPTLWDEVRSAAAAISDLKIDAGKRIVLSNDMEIDLTGKEFDLLLLLARHPKQVFTRAQLLERVWGISEYIDPGTVTVHMRRLREKIEHDPSNPLHIQTIWGVGYKFEP